MTTLLRLDASAQTEGSRSRQLADHYETRWRQLHPEGTVIRRDLVTDPVPHLAPETVAVFYAGESTDQVPPPAGIAVSDALIDELVLADDVVVSTAIYNFSLPSALKAWVDHIVRFGKTIAYRPEGPVGLLTRRRACFLTARGGTPETSPSYAEPVLRAVFDYIGFERFDWVSLEGTRVPDGAVEARVAQACAAIDELVG